MPFARMCRLGMLGNEEESGAAGGAAVTLERPLWRPPAARLLKRTLQDSHSFACGRHLHAPYHSHRCCCCERKASACSQAKIARGSSRERWCDWLGSLPLSKSWTDAWNGRPSNS